MESDPIDFKPMREFALDIFQKIPSPISLSGHIFIAIKTNLAIVTALDNMLWDTDGA